MFEKRSSQLAFSDPLDDVTPVIFLHRIAESVTPFNIIHLDVIRLAKMISVWAKSKWADLFAYLHDHSWKKKCLHNKKICKWMPFYTQLCMMMTHQKWADLIRTQQCLQWLNQYKIRLFLYFHEIFGAYIGSCGNYGEI